MGVGSIQQDYLSGFPMEGAFDLFSSHTFALKAFKLSEICFSTLLALVGVSLVATGYL